MNNWLKDVRKIIDGLKKSTIITVISDGLWNSKYGPKKQDFWPKTNILKGNHCILRIRGAPISSKIGRDFFKWFKIGVRKKSFLQKWSPKLIFLNEFSLWKNSVDFWHRKLTLKVRFGHFLTNHNSAQDYFKTISFEHVDSWAKINNQDCSKLHTLYC